jgi:Protein of unknown function (DUF3800)
MSSDLALRALRSELERCSTVSFYVDDSCISIEGKPHVMLAALTTPHPRVVVEELCALKESLGLHRLDEVKWNGTSRLSPEQRNDFSSRALGIIAGSCQGLLTIAETSNKQDVAELLATQIESYCAAQQLPGFMIEFDQGIITTEKTFDTFLRTRTAPTTPCLGYFSCSSAHHPLIQCCDLFLGLFRLAVMQKEKGDRTLVSYFDDGFEREITEPLGEHILLGTRYVLWGDHNWKTEADIDSGIPHLKNSMGYGIRLHSTIFDAARAFIEEAIATVYMGCMH